MTNNQVSQGRQAPNIVFFLGAGSSVPAGVPATELMVERFREFVANGENTDLLSAYDELLNHLRGWYRGSRLGDSEKEPTIDLGKPVVLLDIEEVFQVLSRLTLANDDPVLRVLTSVAERNAAVSLVRPEALLAALQQYIGKATSVSREDVDYLTPILQQVLGGYLDVFTTNYDDAVEQLLELNRVDWTDGFSPRWDRASFDDPRYRACLYKLHGSIRWFKTQAGSYHSIPIRTDDGRVTLASGDTATQLLLFPAEKVNFIDPVTEAVLRLRESLRRATTVVVIGYSFRDPHIRQLFFEAAQENLGLRLVLVDPQAYVTYSKWLRAIANTRSKSDAATDSIFSPLLNRVLALPFEVQRVLPVLNKEFVHPFSIAMWHAFDEGPSTEMQGAPYDWLGVFEELSKVGHVELASQLLVRVDFGTVPLERSVPAVGRLLLPAATWPDNAMRSGLIVLWATLMERLLRGELDASVSPSGPKNQQMLTLSLKKEREPHQERGLDLWRIGQLLDSIRSWWGQWGRYSGSSHPEWLAPAVQVLEEVHRWSRFYSQSVLLEAWRWDQNQDPDEGLGDHDEKRFVALLLKTGDTVAEAQLREMVLIRERGRLSHFLEWLRMLKSC